MRLEEKHILRMYRRGRGRADHAIIVMVVMVIIVISYVAHYYWVGWQQVWLQIKSILLKLVNPAACTLGDQPLMGSHFDYCDLTIALGQYNKAAACVLIVCYLDNGRYFYDTQVRW